MKQEDEQQVLRRLEEKVDVLTWITGAQSVLIVVVAIAWILPVLPTLGLAALIAIPLLFLFRRGLPRWARRFGRFVGALVSGRTSSVSKTR